MLLTDRAGKSSRKRIRQALARGSLLALALMMPACTREAWYEGMKHSAESQCRQQAPGDTQACLERLNRKSHADYDKERSGIR